MSEVVICLNTIPAIGVTPEGIYLYHYLRKRKIKAIIPNESWSALKYRIQEKYSERFDVAMAKIKSEERIARIRSWLRPENEFNNIHGKDIIPPKDYSTDLLKEKTQDLVNRKWAIISFFISDKPEDFTGSKTDVLPLTEFYNTCLKEEVGSVNRLIAEYFAENYMANIED